MNDQRDEALRLAKEIRDDLYELHECPPGDCPVCSKLCRFDRALNRASAAPQEPAKPPKHKYWGAGEVDCPCDIKAGNGELHSLRCKVCGETNPPDEFCWNAAPQPQAAPQAVCSRSHPHENMDAFCERLTEDARTINRLANEVASLKAVQPLLRECQSNLESDGGFGTNLYRRIDAAIAAIQGQEK